MQITKDSLSTLQKKRKLNNTQTAKILDVETWTIGAWLSGKREISEKYKSKIKELISLPEADDLLIAPATNRLVALINSLEDEQEVSRVIDSLGKIINAVGYKLSEHSFHKVNQHECSAIKNYLSSCDDSSIAKLNSIISEMISQRLIISSMENIDFANQCIQASKEYEDTSEYELFLEVDHEYVYATYSGRLDIQEELYKKNEMINRELINNYDDDLMSTPIYNEETGEYNLDEEELKPFLHIINEEHESTTNEEAYKLFKNTGFSLVEENDEFWSEDYTYSMTYKISLSHPNFKNGLRLLINRFGIEL